MHVSAFVDKGELFLALSRRLIGELIVYEGNRRPLRNHKGDEAETCHTCLGH